MGPREIIIIALIILLLFGAPKLPQLARSIGRSLNILKEETQTLRSDDASDPAHPEPTDDDPRGTSKD